MISLNILIPTCCADGSRSEQARIRAFPCVSDTQVESEGPKNVMETQIYDANGAYRDVSVFQCIGANAVCRWPRAFAILTGRMFGFFATAEPGINAHKLSAKSRAHLGRQK